MKCAKDGNTEPELWTKQLWNNNCVAIAIVFSYSVGMKDDLYSQFQKYNIEYAEPRDPRDAEFRECLVWTFGETFEAPGCYGSDMNQKKGSKFLNESNDPIKIVEIIQ